MSANTSSVIKRGNPPATVVASSTTLTLRSGSNYNVSSASGNQSVTTIDLPAKPGHEIVLTGTSDTDYVSFATGGNIQVPATRAIQNNISIQFKWNGSKWCEMGCGLDVAGASTFTDLDLGSSGTAGSLDVFPTTASKGKLSITAADSAGNTTTSIVNASQSGARTYTIPDAGGSASFVMTAGAQTVAGAKTFTSVIGAGLSGTSGSVSIFPTTASKGKLSITAADSVGDTTTTIVNASQSGARTYTIPDAGTSTANFILDQGNQAFVGIKTFGSQTMFGNGSSSGAIATVIGPNNGTGLATYRYVQTFTVSSTNITTAGLATVTVPAGAVIRSVQLLVNTTISAVGNSTRLALGTSGNHILYGVTSTDMTAGRFINNIPTVAVTGGTVPILLWPIQNDGTTDGTGTPLITGSVTVQIVWDQCVTLV